MNQTIEKRAHLRIPLDTDAVVFVGNERLSCQTINVTSQGIALVSPVTCPIGSVFRVKFRVPDRTEAVLGRAVLVREVIRGASITWGARFQYMEGPSIASLQLFVREQLRVLARERHRQLGHRSVEQKVSRLAKLFRSAISRIRG